MTIEQALDGMDIQGRRIGNLVDQGLSAREQAFQATELQRDILISTRLALRDGNELARLNVFHPIKSFDQLKSANDDAYSGNRLYEKS